MFLNIDNATRYFTVVGASYVAEHHFESDGGEVEGRASRQYGFAVTAVPRINSGSWLQDDN